MNQQISPWSIYDKQLKEIPIEKISIKNKCHYNEKHRSLSQDSRNISRNVNPQKKQLLECHKKLEQSINMQLALKIIRLQLQDEDKNQLYLPQIKHSIQLSENRILKMQWLHKKQSQCFNIKQKESRIILKHKWLKQSKLTIVNYQPFDYFQILQRGFKQILKIRQKQRNLHSKRQITTHQ